MRKPGLFALHTSFHFTTLLASLFFLLISVPSAHVSVLFCCYFGCLGEKIELIWASPEVSGAAGLQN